MRRKIKMRRSTLTADGNNNNNTGAMWSGLRLYRVSNLTQKNIMSRGRGKIKKTYPR